MDITKPEANALLRQELEEQIKSGGKVRYLEPEDFTMERMDKGSYRLTLHNDRSYTRVSAKRCFPFTLPEKYVSLRDAENEEIGVIREMSSLGKEYRKWIEEMLELRYFLPRITSIVSVRTKRGAVEWKVNTDYGERDFVTWGLGDTMQEVKPEWYLVSDVDGNRYQICIADLDAESAAKLEQIV